MPCIACKPTRCSSWATCLKCGWVTIFWRPPKAISSANVALSCARWLTDALCIGWLATEIFYGASRRHKKAGCKPCKTLALYKPSRGLSHGDALCIADTAYQAFRQQVRASQWQSDFLSKPLAQRLQIARELRAQSEALKQTQKVWIDVDNAAAMASLQQYEASMLIHGHTHQPALHTLSADHQRLVLSDWDASATPARAEWLTWQMGQGFSRQEVIAA